MAGVVALFATVVCALPAQAALVETLSTDAWTSPTRFQARIGNNALDGRWELRVRGAGSNGDFQRTYHNGVTESFLLQHDSATGDLTFTLGADTWVIDEAERTAWNSIGIEMRVRDNAPNLRSFTLDNLVFASNRVASQSLDNDSLLVANSGGSDRQLSLTLQDEADWYLADFTLSGNLNWSWAGVEPTSGDLRFRIGVTDRVTNVPLPGAAWLLASALGLMAARRKV